MDVLAASIKTMAEKNRMAPALIGRARALSYGEVCRILAIVSNLLAARAIPPRSKVFLNFADADFRLLVTMACLHYGLIPFILLDIGALGDEVDYDLVIGSPQRAIGDLACDLVIDPALLEDSAADSELRDFGERADDEIYFIASTTGTTGRPKLVAEIVRSFKSHKDAIPAEETGSRRGEGVRYSAKDRILLTLGDVSKYGFGLGLRLLGCGATILRPQRDTPATLRALDLYRATHIVTTPSAIELMARHMEESRLRCPSVKVITLSGSLIRPSLLADIERVFDAEIRVGYGSSEVGGISRGVIRADSFKPGYVGEILPGVQIVTIGTPEQAGPLTLVNRPGYFSNYYSKGRIIRHEMPFYPMPDLGYLIGNSLYLVGRADEVFNFSGNKTAFALIEAMLREMPGIADVGLVAGATIDDPEGLLVGLVARPEADLGAVREALCRIVRAPQAGPHFHIFPMEAIPRNGTGKVDRDKVVQAYRRSALPN